MNPDNLGPPKEDGPVTDRATTTATTRTDATHSSRLTTQDVRTQIGGEYHEPLTSEDRLDAQVLAAASERGYRLAVRCTRCNQWLVAHKSVALHLGPVCRTKVAAG
jgi:primosomal protein N'